MRNFRKEKLFGFYYSIHYILFYFFLLCPSSPDYGILFYDRLLPLTFLVNAQQQNLYLQVVAGNGTSGYNGDNQPATSAQLSLHGGGGISGDSNGTVYIGDCHNNRLRKIDLQGIITTIAGTGTIGETGGSGSGTSINIGYPHSLTVDTTGSFLYFSDRRFIWKYQLSNGFLTRYAGATPVQFMYGGDGQQATTAQFNNPLGISLSTMGLLYISDYGNNRVRVVATDGIISTCAGSGPDGNIASFDGDGGPAISTSCKLSFPLGVYADNVGNVFIADSGNSRIRKVDSSGIITSFAGGGGAGGDGGHATSASLTSTVYDVKGDRFGNIYITDGCKIRMVNVVGIISTIAGTGTCGQTLTFSPVVSSPIKQVFSLWVNSDLNVYFAEFPGLIHKTVSITLPTSQPSRLPSSQPSTQHIAHPSVVADVQQQNLYLQVVAGTGTSGYNGDNQPATSAQLKLDFAGGVFEDNNGLVYVCDYCNNRIRRIDLEGIITTIAGTGTGA
jgi:sugar lactone lactonase YvrE